MSSPQNVSFEGETWTERSPDYLQQSLAVGGEELILEKEPRTQITVAVKQDEETDVVHSQKIGENKHQILKEAEEGEQGGSNEEKQGHEDKSVDEENKTRDELIQEEVQDIDQSITPPVDTPLATLSPSQYFSSTLIPSLLTTTTAQSPVDITQINHDTEDQNASLSGTHTNHFSAIKNTSILSTNENSTHEDSVWGPIESSEETVDAAASAMAARADPTAMSLPSTFSPKPKTKLPKIKGKQIAKTMKNKLQKKETTVTSSKSLKNARQVEKQEKDQLTTAPYFPYFKDHYCPPDCACYGRCVSNTV